jgi:thiosulfate/3-mercaptopyruvate sulfurtransferase
MDPVVTTEWLAKHLGESDLRLVDGTWHMPQAKRDARAEFEAAHVPGATFFDIDAISDRSTALPHMLPPAPQFATAVGALGIGSADRIVVYDVRGVVSAARVWWTFRAFGHDAVAVLDGGLKKWRDEGRPVERGAALPRPATFTARPRPELVHDLEAMRANIGSRAAQVLDARSAGRFAGTEPEPRAGLRGGHIPGSLNLPYETLYEPNGTLKSGNELRGVVAGAGVDLGRPIVTTCGSGVTASVLALALYLLGRRDVAVYDGSWSEWGGRADTPIET